MNKGKKIMNWINQKKLHIAMTAATILTPLSVYAAPSSAEAKWNAVIDFLVPWISRLGGVVILIGAIDFGLAFKNDDAEAKTRGLKTIIAGAIVAAVGLSSDLFLF